MKKVIVTGGAGFIGSHTVVELVRAGYTPIIVDDLRNSRESALDGIARITGKAPVVHRTDVTDQTALDQVFKEHGEIHGVIHFAAYKAVGESVADPLKYYGNNIGSLVVVLRSMERYGVDRLVFSSSCTVYGQPDALPVAESAPDRNASSPYGYTKVVCEQLVRDAVAANTGLRAVLLRYFNPIGAHPSGHIGELPLGVPGNLVPFVTQTAAGLRERLTIFGKDYPTPDGTCIRDYIHVVDLAEAHVTAMAWSDKQKAPLCEVFNIGTGTGTSVLEVVTAFEEVTGISLPHRMGSRRPGDVASVFASPVKSREVLGWRAGHDLRDALKDAWRWQQALSGVQAG